MDLGWYLNRLRRMSLPEIAYRAKKTVQARLENSGIGLANRVPDPNFDRVGKAWFTPSRSIDAEIYIRQSNRLLDGKCSIFALESVETGFPPHWNRDYRTGIEAPLTFGKTLNYRNEALVGDIKYLWEPNRHLQLVTLAQAYYLTSEQRYLDGVCDGLTSWFKQCPYPLGPNWVSALELAIRLINWSIVWELIGAAGSPAFDGEKGRAFKRAWIDTIYRHVHFIQGYFSRFSSANNHLIGEAVGLVCANSCWPYWPELETWSRKAEAIIEEEVLKQVSEDGVDREQTTAYQQFVFEFLLVAGLSTRASGRDFTVQFWDRMERMAEFILAVRDVGGHVPMIGDADDGYVTRLDAGDDFDPFQSMLCTAAILFERADFKRAAGALDIRNSWLFGDEGAKTFANVADSGMSKPCRRAFPDGGYYVLSCREGTSEEVKLIADAGPLGYSAIAAHGHADALALTMSFGGQEVLIDPGTYAYHTQKKWRDYFRGTSAHNTVRIDHQDQSVIGGNFMWMQHAKARCVEFSDDEGKVRFEGEHDGYRRLPDATMHRRSISLDKAALAIEIFDRLECNERHFVEQFWHFAEGLAVSLDGHRAVVELAAGKIVFEFDNKIEEIRVEQGNESIPRGWVSRRFDVKVPAATVTCSSTVSAGEEILTRIVCIPRDRPQA